MSLRLLALVFCLWLAGLESWRSWQAWDVVVATDKIETANLARSLSRHAHDVIQAIDAVLVDLRERLEADGPGGETPEQLDRLLASRVARLPAIHTLFITDAGGAIVAGSARPFPPDLNGRDRAAPQPHLTSSDFNMHLGGPIRSGADRSWLITVSRRLGGPGSRLSGMITATVSVDSLEAYFSGFATGLDGSIFLGSGNGIALARSPASSGVIGVDMSQTQLYRELIPRAASGSFEYKSPVDGITRLGSYQRSDDYELVTLVSHGLNELLADWRRDARRHLAIDVVTYLILIVTAGRFDREIGRCRDAEARYRLLADNSSDAIICAGLDGRMLYVSPSFTVMTGWGVGEAMKMGWIELVHPDDRSIAGDLIHQLRAGTTRAVGCFRYLCRDRATIWVEAHTQLVAGDDTREAQFVADLRDVSLRKAAEDQAAALHRELSVQANTDSLTGLANRRRFDEALGQEWRRAARQHTPLSLLLIDVDHFKLYNDRYGHLQGDACLRSVALTIAEFGRRPGDLAARFGGEEIVLLLPGADAPGALTVANRVCAAIQDLQVVHQDNLPSAVLTVSIGVMTSRPDPNEVTGAAELVAAADAALYAAKRAGRNQVVVGAASWQTSTNELFDPATVGEVG